MQAKNRRQWRFGSIAIGGVVALVVLVVFLANVLGGGTSDVATNSDATDPNATEPELAQTEYPQTSGAGETGETGETGEAADANEVVEVTETTEAAVSTDASPEVVPVETSVPHSLGCPEADHSSPRTIDFEAQQPLCIDPALNYTAIFDTSEGEIVVDLDTTNTPNTANNFATLARWGYYDNTEIFRTDPSIDIIQGGSPHTNTASDPGPGYTIVDEPTFSSGGTGLVGPYRYLPGQLVMARSAGPNSSGAQYFFTTGPNTSLLDSQGTYIVFGSTDDAGLEVLQGIIGLHEDDYSGLGGGPSRTVTVYSVRIQEG